MSLENFEKRAAELAQAVEKAFADLKMLQGQHMELNGVIKALRAAEAVVSGVASVVDPEDAQPAAPAENAATE